ncbi:MAG: hypothetical protein HC927_06985 [Deltaproteobacteria bacterium]|nr:hypothetical protein [Deltaproteobacteria bacterium]
MQSLLPSSPHANDATQGAKNVANHSRRRARSDVDEGIEIGSVVVMSHAWRTTMARTAKHPLLVLLPCLLVACEEEPPAPVHTCLEAWVQERFAALRPDYPLVWETEHLDIYAKDNITVCAGTPSSSSGT